jgi:hypothetical protein
VEGQFFFTTVAGLSVSLAGFAALIAWLRDDSTTWDPINLWRVKTIVRQAFTVAFLALLLIPVFYMTEDLESTIRVGSAALVISILIDVWINRHPDPTIWVPRVSWTIAMVFSGIYAAIQLFNLPLASLGLLQLGFLLELASPAGIFSNFVRELGHSGRPETEAE